MKKEILGNIHLVSFQRVGEFSCLKFVIFIKEKLMIFVKKMTFLNIIPSVVIFPS